MNLSLEANIAADMKMKIKDPIHTYKSLNLAPHNH